MIYLADFVTIARDFYSQHDCQVSSNAMEFVWDVVQVDIGNRLKAISQYF